MSNSEYGHALYYLYIYEIIGADVTRIKDERSGFVLLEIKGPLIK